MSVQHYERLRGAAWERLSKTMNVMSAQASAGGLTKEKLEQLLSDES